MLNNIDAMTSKEGKMDEEIIRAVKFFQNLCKFITGLEGITTNEEIRAELEAKGVDTDLLIKRVKAIVDTGLEENKH